MTSSSLVRDLLQYTSKNMNNNVEENDFDEGNTNIIMPTVLVPQYLGTGMDIEQREWLLFEPLYAPPPLQLITPVSLLWYNDDDDAGLTFENLYHYRRTSPNRELSLDSCDSKVQEMWMDSLRFPNLVCLNHNAEYLINYHNAQ